MVLQGMKEYAKSTFGEEVLTLFGDQEIGSSTKEIDISIGDDEQG
jgi:hypothetical protein